MAPRKTAAEKAAEEAANTPAEGEAPEEDETPYIDDEDGFAEPVADVVSLSDAAAAAMDSEGDPTQEHLDGTNFAKVKFVGMAWESAEIPGLKDEVEFTVRGTVVGHGQQVMADGDIREGAWVAELTDLLTLDGWPKGMRVICRKERPRPGAQLRITDVDGHRITAFATNTGATTVMAAIGYDATNAVAGGYQGGAAATVASSAITQPLVGHVELVPAIGYHYLAWLEYSTASGTTTWYGTDAGNFRYPGITATIMM